MPIPPTGPSRLFRSSRSSSAAQRGRRVVVAIVCGAILVVGAVVLGAGGIADYVGLLVVSFGGWALVHATLVGSGLIELAAPATTRSESRAPTAVAHPAATRARRARIIRVEVVSCTACAALGAAFEAGGHALGEVSLVLFGLAAGCVVHLTLTLLVTTLGTHGDRS